MLAVLVAALVLALDWITKTWALRRLDGGEVITVIEDVFQLRLVFNPGAAFSFAAGYTVVITALAAAVVLVIIRLTGRLQSWAWALALGVLLGGALGNLMDRLFRVPGSFGGYVVDFFEAEWPWSGFPVFNVADIAIVTGVGGVLLLTILGVEPDRQEDEGNEEGAP